MGVGLGARLADLLGGDRAAGLLEPGDAAGAEDGGVFEVDVQHDLAPAPSRAGCGGRPSGRSRACLAAGEVAGREGAADVQGLGGAEEELVVGIGGDRGLEVERVGQVEVSVDPDPAMVAVPCDRDVEVPGLGGGEAFGLGCLGVEPGLGPWISRPSRRADLCATGATMASTNAAAWGETDGLLGDERRASTPAAPRLQAAQQLEPVVALDRLGEVAAPGLGGPAHRGGELDDRELRDLRAPLPPSGRRTRH